MMDREVGARKAKVLLPTSLDNEVGLGGRERAGSGD